MNIICYKFNALICIFCLAPYILIEAKSYNPSDLIVIHKKGVEHKFVRFDYATDNFVKNVFQNWENETFDVFDSVKDSQGIAIDLGAWIGTTAIWLSKNFFHVVAVDGDRISLGCLKQNLEASACSNVSICEKPVATTSEMVVFGPRSDKLNESISYIKQQTTNSNDYEIRSITFKQLIHDYVYKNPGIANHKISFIKCDIEGGEENILEDMLYFAYYNKVKVYISFHLTWWKSKKITDFEYLFKFFKINCPQENICKYIQNNPFASLIFEPLNNAGVLIKKNIPVVVIGYNLVTYIKNMVAQLEKYTSDIIVVDNNSSFGPLLDYYEKDYKYTLLKQKTNYGHTVYAKDFVENLVGDVYLLTDPDLQFNPKLPDNWLEMLINISDYFGASRVGFALCIDAKDIRTEKLFGRYSIKEWEIQFWKDRLHCPIAPNLELYKAAIDTTFCLRNKKYSDKLNIRVAGDYTCLHLPWHQNFKEKLLKGEYETYLKGNISTNWFKMRFIDLT